MGKENSNGYSGQPPDRFSIVKDVLLFPRTLAQLVRELHRLNDHLDRLGVTQETLPQALEQVNSISSALRGLEMMLAGTLGYNVVREDKSEPGNKDDGSNL